MLILGAHMSIAGGFSFAATKTAEEYACHAMQIFTKSPRGGSVKPIDPADSKIFIDTCKSAGIKNVFAHSSYLLNFGKPEDQIPWAFPNILSDFDRLNQLHGRGVVVHIGKSLESDRQQAIKCVIENAKKVVDRTEKYKNPNAPDGMYYILENTAGQGSEIGYRLDELAIIWKALKPFSPRVKSCLDTAHIWAAGYDISMPESAKETFKIYDQLIGLDTLACIHFNDSAKTYESRVDRHANIGQGLIGVAGLKEIAQMANSKNIPLILETPEKDGGSHAEDIEIVKKFFA